MPEPTKPTKPTEPLSPFHRMMAERKSQIHAQRGNRHFATSDPIEAAKQYRRDFEIPDDVPLIGRFQLWKDGEPFGDEVPLQTAIDSAKELMAKKALPKVPDNVAENLKELKS